MSWQRNTLNASGKARRFRRRSNAGTGQERETTRLLGALNAEITLLREENARLKAAEYESPGLGRLLEHARALPATLDGYENAADEAAQMLVEGLVIRGALIEVCDQIQQSMQAVSAKLSRLDGTGAQEAASALEAETQSMKVVALLDAEEADRRTSRRRR